LEVKKLILLYSLIQETFAVNKFQTHVFAYKIFIDSLTEEQAKRCAFVLHTQVVDDNGTDLGAVKKCYLVMIKI
jgi:hypothetical protein